MAKAATGKLQLHWKMLIGFVAGLSLGLVAHYLSGADAGWVQWLTANITQPAGTLFLRLIFMLIIPLLFSALIMGVAEMGDVRSLGRVGWKTLGYTVVASGHRGGAGPGAGQLAAAGCRHRPRRGGRDAGAGRRARAGHRRRRGHAGEGRGHAAGASSRTTWSRPLRENDDPRGDVLRADAGHRPGADPQQGHRGAAAAASRACSKCR